MTRIEVTQNRLNKDRRKLYDMLGNINITDNKIAYQTYLVRTNILSSATNISFPIGALKFTLGNDVYYINRKTGKYMNMKEARANEISAIRDMNRQYA